MRIIGHLDMDAFFASVEERDHSRFAGRPIVVGSDPQDGKGRGVVSTANYRAREYGIRSALPIATAWKRAEEARAKGLPPVVFVAPDMHRYRAVSHTIMAILHTHAPHIEKASVDEAYFDLSSSFSSSASVSLSDPYEVAAATARNIKKEIRIKEHLTASIGIGPNKLVAKIASDKGKPDGFVIVPQKEVERFLEPFPIRAIPGVGPKTERALARSGVYTVADAKQLTEPELYTMFGSGGVDLYAKLRGTYDAPLTEEREVKSIGEQETFSHDTRDPALLQEQLIRLADGVYDRFGESNFSSFRGVTITVRFADFTTHTRSTTLMAPAHECDTIRFEALRLFMPFLDARENPARKAFRLLGVRIEKLDYHLLL